MDSSTYEQVSMEQSLVGGFDLMKDGQEVDVIYHAETETILNVELPQFVELKIVYTEPGIKGDTATNTTKAAELETGATIQVPLFIEQDEVIKIDTKNRSYSERVKI